MKSPLLADILPTPRECRFTPGAFRLAPLTAIHHPLDASPADLRTAKLLADACAERTGVRVKVRPTTRYVGRHILHVGPAGDFDVPLDFVPPHHEGYALRIDRTGVLAAANDAPGLYYAVRTLEQILRLRRAGRRAVPALEIRDWPTLRHRALMVDIARQVERGDWLEELAARMAGYKKNMFVLYFEDKFRWRKHSALGHPMGYTAEEFRSLARTCEAHHMEFVPALASLGHCEGMLKHPEIAHLREDGAIYQLALRHRGTRRLLEDLYDEILPLYRGRYFHANCDESPLLAGPPGSPRSYFRESLRLFSDLLIFLHDLLARHGKQMMIWGDMLLHHPEIMKGLPRDIIVVDWDYGSMKNRQREAPEFFRRHGFPVMVAPAAARSAEVCFPPAMQIDDNCPHYIRQGVAAGAMGEMTTLWELRSTNTVVAVPGIISSAQYAWNPDAIAPADVARRIAAHLHGPEAAADVARGYRNLSSELFYDRFVGEARDPARRSYRTYHLDSHEFVATDPMSHLTYEPTPWAESVSDQAARGVADMIAARKAARWGDDELAFYQLSGLHEFFHGEVRRATNAVARSVVQAERLRRKGDLPAAHAALAPAVDELAELSELADALVRATPDMWAVTRRPNDPAFGTIFMDRLRLARKRLRASVARLRRAADALARGRNTNLSRIIGGQEVLYIEAHNPSPALIDILHATITGSDNGRTWRKISDRGWFVLERQTYATALIPDFPALPRRLRFKTVRTHINPKAYPLAERFRLHAARTLTPGEIIDGPPEADWQSIDWQLVRLPGVSYRLTKRSEWELEYELVR